MGQQTHTDDGEPTTEYDNLEIVIDPDEIVHALRNDGEYPARNGHEVITVRPPFDGERRAHHRFSETGTFWPPEMDPEPLDLNPDAFHEAEWDYPERAEIDAAAKEMAGVEDIRDVPDEIRDETHAVHVEVWESEVRNSLVDEIDITGDYEQGVMVPVRFGESEDSE